jgi:hypothetical protein
MLQTIDLNAGMRQFVPKDPFVDPQQFSYGFASFQQMPKTDFTPLNLSLIRQINSAYDKTRQLDSYKVHKVLLNKLDDLATDLRSTATGNDRDTSSKITNHSAIVEPVMDLDVFVQAIMGGSKDGASSLRYLWSGRPGYASVRKKRKEKVISDGERDDADAERDPHAEQDDNEFSVGQPWSNRVQRKIEAWAGYGSVGILGSILIYPVQLESLQAARCRCAFVWSEQITRGCRAQADYTASKCP